jgi:DNA gyrase subunit A
MSSRTAKGTPSVQLLPIPREEKITSLVAVDSFVDDRYLLMLTKAGFIKRTALSAFSKIRSNGLIAINLEDGDALTWVRLSKEGDSVLIGSKTGMAIHFRLDINELRPLGRTARGVKSMNLRQGDNLVSMDVLTSNLVDQLANIGELPNEINDNDDNIDENSSNGPWVLIASAFGLGKRVPVTQFRLQKRAGMGLRAIKFRIKDDELVCLKVLGEGEELLLVTEKGVIVRTNADKISQQSRAATGVKLQKLDEGDHLSEVVLVPHEQKEEPEHLGSGREN